jgi:hypothetical protein
MYPPLEFEGYSTGRSHKRQNMDTSFEYRGLFVVDGSNQNIY